MVSALSTVGWVSDKYQLLGFGVIFNLTFRLAMKSLKADSPQHDNKLHALDPKWEIRLMKMQDLERVAGWITMLIQNGRGREKEITGFLKMEWEASGYSGYAHYYLVTLYGQPMMHVTAVSPKNGLKECAGIIQLDLFLNPGFDQNEGICLGVLSTACNFFYTDNEARLLKVSIANSNKVLKKVLHRLGFASVRGEGRYTTTLQTWIPL